MRYVFATIVLFLAVGLLGFVGWKLISRTATPEIPKIDVSVDLAIKDVELSHGQNGTLEWKLKAAQAEYDMKDNRINVEQPVLTYFFKNGESPIEVAAPKGEVDRGHSMARLWPNVEARYRDFLLTAKEMNYQGETKSLILDGEVRLKQKDLSMAAPRVLVDLDKETITAEGGVQAILLTGEAAIAEQGATE